MIPKPKAASTNLVVPAPRLVCEVTGPDEKIIATGQIQEVFDALWLTNLWVSDSYRGLGIATQIIRSLLDRVQAGRTLYIMADAFGHQGLTSEQLLEFYMSFGFAETEIKGVLKKEF